MSEVAAMTTEPELVDSIEVRQDVGGPYPRFKYVTLDLYADGSVRWRDLRADY